MSRAPLNDGFPIGARLKAARQAQGLSQRELARRANITNANLSMIEQDKVSPALATLEKILHALALNLSNFFAASSNASPIHKANDFLIIKRQGVIFRILPPHATSSTQLADITLPPAASVDALWLKKRGAKGGDGHVSGLIRSGELTLILNGIDHPLSAGDGFEFSLQTQFVFVNRAEQVGEIWVVVEV